MTRTSREVPGRKPGSVRRYTGVLISELSPPHTPIRQYEIHHGFFHTKRLDASLLEPGTDLMVADRIEGRRVDLDALFYVVGVMQGGQVFVIGKVISIVLRAEPPHDE
jgi:hypothetical protein